MAAYAECGNITQAAKLAKVNRCQHYKWMEEDPAYAVRFDEAHEAACDALEQEARRRATKGVNEPVFHKGAKVATVKKYSDTLLIFLMKGAMPEKYRERVDNTHSGHLQHTARIDVRQVLDEIESDERFEQFARQSLGSVHAGYLGHHGEQGTVATGSASNGHRPSGNGHHPQTHGKPPAGD